MLNVNATSGEVHSYIQNANNVEVHLISRLATIKLPIEILAGPFLDSSRRRSQMNFCKTIQVSSQISSIICQVDNLHPEIEYQIYLVSAELGKVDTNTSVQMRVHQREQLNFEVSPTSLIVFGQS